MKNVLLLGGYGFIGTNILKYVDSLNEDFNMIIFDRFPNHMDNVSFNNIAKIYVGDFFDRNILDNIFIENKIDIVIHSLSATIPSSLVDNVFDLNFNVIPTINLLNIMREHNVYNIVFISSGGAIYGDYSVHNGGHQEDDILFPKSAYGISKLVIEKYLYLYACLYGINSLILRLSNPYGPYHYSQKQGIINIALEKAFRGETLEIWGTGDGLKDYIYINDFCSILFKLIKMEFRKYNVINVGSGQLLSVNKIAETIKKSYFSNFQWVYKKENTLDVNSFKLNLSNLLSDIGDFHFTSFDEGLMKTYQWYCHRQK